MLGLLRRPKEQDYEVLYQPSQDSYEEPPRGYRDTHPHSSHGRPFTRCVNTLYVLGFVLALAAAFTTGILVTLYTNPNSFENDFAIQEVVLDGIAPYLPLPRVAGEIIHDSPFSKQPPQGPGAGNISEPVWDALIPNGLGYFRHQPTTKVSEDSRLSSNIVIPTIFHQLHCLYLLRRAYYSDSDREERFDFNRNRTVHVAHCLDYLAQTLVCSADSTLEPAVDSEHGFLGSGFQRRCWDFEVLKEIVQEKRVFDAEGFLARGLSGDGVVHFG
ncbi:uncharacterized protein BDV14DRAFT_198109 [Aspergillus stella-maris]|uniref:uncharacterized protein n=1 Tax=Aspergillus stella-maris TaxID=1810926 RepID=UPI003CCD43C0